MGPLVRGARMETHLVPRVLDELARAEREGGEDRVDVLRVERKELGRRGHLVPDTPLWVYPSAWSTETSAEAVSGEIGSQKIRKGVQGLLEIKDTHRP